MSQGLFSAVSGIRANQTRLNVIANNLANLNTVAFKSSDANFRTTYFNTLNFGAGPTTNTGGINPLQVGTGTALSEIKQNFAQGGSLFSGRPTDLSINGEGFFTIQDPANANGYMLTRAGNFSLDGNGNLVTANGEQVLGTATVDGNDPNTVKAVQVPTTLVIYKERDAANNVLQTWIGDSSTSAPSPTMGGTVGAEAVGLTSFSVGQDGGITAIYSNGDRLTVRTDPTSTNQNLREFSVILSDGSTFAPSSSGTTGILNIMNNTVTSEPVIYPEEMQLRIAKVTNTLGLVQIGQNNYQLGPNVGTVTMGIGSFAGRGSVAAGALESSNVDIAAEFTNMILAQRGVEAAGKVVSTQSDVLRTIINLL